MRAERNGTHTQEQFHVETETDIAMMFLQAKNGEDYWRPQDARNNKQGTDFCLESSGEHGPANTFVSGLILP